MNLLYRTKKARSYRIKAKTYFLDKKWDYKYNLRTWTSKSSILINGWFKVMYRNMMDLPTIFKGIKEKQTGFSSVAFPKQVHSQDQYKIALVGRRYKRND